jgi:hypothetical protein
MPVVHRASRAGSTAPSSWGSEAIAVRLEERSFVRTGASVTGSSATAFQAPQASHRPAHFG